MAISQQVLHNAIKFFIEHKGNMQDLNRKASTIKLDALILKRNAKGEILAIGGVLYNTPHCINEVIHENGYLKLSPRCIGPGLAPEQCTNLEVVLDVINENEEINSKLFERERWIFWEPFVSRTC